ncbi:MAG: hypothetical protein HQL05_03335 [Nitrospirae bacterium]|uniref:hypothetical protein n=1 Tax=Candidatus Magnetobacterium casense TaxID=1455061 RepID=UPI00058D8B22|nr:hypothetical protein [Candidatus Magnetobacterium casensis]MBF0336842.1 hypothetical protein [Nitrospirota bacterium]
MRKAFFIGIVILIVAWGADYALAGDKTHVHSGGHTGTEQKDGDGSMIKMTHNHEDMPGIMYKMGEVMERMQEIMQNEPPKHQHKQDTLHEITESLSEMAACMKEMSQLMKKTDVSKQELEKIEYRVIKINDKLTIRLPIRK